MLTILFHQNFLFERILFSLWTCCNFLHLKKAFLTSNPFQLFSHFSVLLYRTKKNFCLYSCLHLSHLIYSWTHCSQILSPSFHSTIICQDLQSSGTADSSGQFLVLIVRDPSASFGRADHSSSLGKLSSLGFCWSLPPSRHFFPTWFPGHHTLSIFLLSGWFFHFLCWFLLIFHTDKC